MCKWCCLERGTQTRAFKSEIWLFETILGKVQKFRWNKALVQHLWVRAYRWNSAFTFSYLATTKNTTGSSSSLFHTIMAGGRNINFLFRSTGLNTSQTAYSNHCRFLEKYFKLFLLFQMSSNRIFGFSIYQFFTTIAYGLQF